MLDRDIIYASIQHHPDHSGGLVCKGDNGFMSTPSLDQLFRPQTQVIGFVFHPVHDRSGTMDKQESQVAVAALTDTPQAGDAARAMLLRHQSNPCCQLTGMGELTAIANTGINGNRADWANTPKSE